MKTTNYIVPYGTTEIKERQFEKSGDLGDVVIPNTVLSIGEDAFHTYLKSVTIPDSVTKIKRGAFNGFLLSRKKFFKVYITDLSKWCEIDFDPNANPLAEAHNLYLNDNLVTDMTIPNNIKIIKDWAFVGCTSLESVTINDNVSKINLGAFKDCIRLKRVTLSNMTEIGWSAFNNCKQLEHIYYQGTKAQWKKTSKGKNWNKNTGKYTVHCTDGDIKKSIFG